MPTTPSTTAKKGPTGLLAGRRPTPLNTLEGTSMSTEQPNGTDIAEIVRLAHAPDLELPAPPCPAWCSTGPHPWTTPALGAPEWSRNHRHLVAAIDGVEVLVEQYEQIREDGTTAADPIEVALAGRTESLSTTSARRIRGALTDAAALADQHDARPAVIECPGWCERDQEHVNADDIEHWTRDREIDTDELTASLIARGGLPRIEIRAGDHVTVELDMRTAGRLIGVVAELMAKSDNTWTERVTLNHGGAL